MNIKNIFFIALLFFAMSAQAYIPKISTVLGKVAANDGGSKAFILKRTVTLKDEGVTCSETWYISHGDAMKLEVEGTNPGGSTWFFEILYKGGKRTTTNAEGKPQTFSLSTEFYEPLLHYRSAKALSAKLQSLQIIPGWAMGDSPSESFMSLDRYKGGLVYLIGARESKNTQQPPRLWVEQDSFIIKKIRMGSQVEVEFDGIKEFDEGKVKQPELQTIYWKNSTVVVQNTSTQWVEQSKVEPFLKIQKPNQTLLPANESLKEFYSRFR